MILPQQRGKPMSEEDMEPVAAAVAGGADLAAERFVVRIHAAGAVREPRGQPRRERPPHQHLRFRHDTARRSQGDQRCLAFELRATGGGGTGRHGGESAAADPLAKGPNWNSRTPTDPSRSEWR